MSCTNENKEKPNSGRRAASILFVVLVLDLLAFTSILPLFPSIMDYYANKAEQGSLYYVLNEKLHDFRSLLGVPDSARMNSVFFAGFLGSVFSFLQFVSSPVLGALSDVYGRKPILIAVTIGSLLSQCIWLVAYDFPIFVLFRVLAGLCKASVSIATAVAADVFSVKERGKGMALVGICFSMGFLFGPLIGAGFARSVRQSTETGQLGTTDYPFGAAATFAVVVTALELIMIVTAMPETLPKHKRTMQLSDLTSHVLDYIRPSALFSYTAVHSTLSPKNRLQAQAYGRVYFVYLLLYSGLEFTLSFFTHERFQYESMQQGRMYFFAGFIMIFVQGGVIRRLPVERQLYGALGGLAAIVPAYIIIGCAHTEGMFYVGLALYAFASSCVVPCISTLVSNLAGDSDKGAVLGVLRSQGSAARAMGPVIAAAVYWCVGATTCYCMGGVLLLVPLYLLRAAHTNQQKLHGA